MSQDISQAAIAPAANGHDANGAGRANGNFWILALGSVGVVFGDIGTSPLYALQAALGQFKGGGLNVETVVGVVSLIIWALLIVVTAKYVLFLMQADNKGEGGILSLMALAQVALGRKAVVAFALGVAGAALFSGDAMITPAISVLSALEGLKQVDANLSPYVLPATVLILILLFLAQRRGTAGVAAFFGPIMVVFFIVNAALGIDAHSRRVGDPARPQPRAGPGVLVAARHARLRRARQRLPRRDRGGGALRRHGPFRPPADPGGVAVPRPAGADGQLSRTGRPDHRPSRGGRESLLPARPRLGVCCR